MSAAVDIALPLVSQFEGFRSTPYQDIAGVWTIGYGATQCYGKPVTQYTRPMTQHECDGLLAQSLATVSDLVKAACHVPLSDNELAGLISLAYNIGTGALAKSTLMRLLNAGNRAAAASQFGAWVYAGGKIVPGLQRRRAAEKALFLTNSTPIRS
jgi:lysozyme